MTCLNIVKERFVRVAASTSTPMMMPLSMSTAVPSSVKERIGMTLHLHSG